MQFTQAIARRPGADIARGLTTATLGAPSVAETRKQFDAYIAALRDCGLEVTVLDPLEGFPDAHFVEDTAIVTEPVAVVTNPGAPSRKGEVDSIAEAMSVKRPVVRVTSPGTLDGGDVLQVGRYFFIGLSDRTNRDGARQLTDYLSPHGYQCTTVSVVDGLHLKSSVNAVGDATLLTTRAFADHPALASFERLVVPDHEAYAGNTLRINDRLIMPSGYPETRRLLERLALPILELDTSEFKKMDGGLSCLSLRF